MARTTDSNLDERMGDVADITSLAQRAVDELESSESVETPEDFDASIDEAKDALEEALAAIKALRS